MEVKEIKATCEICRKPFVYIRAHWNQIRVTCSKECALKMRSRVHPNQRTR
jgi:hypothetical protein